MDSLEKQLLNKSKEELIEILKRLVKNDKGLELFINNNTDNIYKLIRNLRYDDYDLSDFVKRTRRIHDLIITKDNNLQELLELLYKILKIMNTYDQSNLLDNLAIKITKSINKELRKLPKNKAQKIRKEIISKLEYQEFIEEILE
ncbi:MAG: hypothetical protein AABX19_01930 [Nanoarchaeota archaeon]